MKKLFIFLLMATIFCFSTVALDSIDIPFTVPDQDVTLFYVDTTGSVKTSDFDLKLNSSVSNFTFEVDTDELMEFSSTYGQYYHCGNISFKLNFDSSVYSDLDLSEYQLTAFFSVRFYSYEVGAYELDPDEVFNFAKSIGSMKSFATYGLTILRQSDLLQYSNYSDVYLMDSSSIYGSYTFPSSMTSTLLLNNTNTFFLPCYLSGRAKIQIILTLEEADSTPEETVPPSDVPSDPGIYEPQGQGTFVDPLIYSYDYNFYINETKGSILDSYSVTDIYNDGYGYKFRDYSDKYTISAQALMSHQYDVFLAIGRTDTESDAFVDSVCELITVELPCDEDRLEKPDISKSGFRMEWYFATTNDWTFENFKDNIETINSSFYGLEPFSITLGDITIPYDYFTYVYLPSSDTFKVILEFDGAKAEHRIFMNAFLGQDSITMTFTCDWYLDDGLLMGITQSGFYRLYDDDGDPLPDAPSDDNNGGFTQEDIDNARLEGYWQGVGESVDKNYIFGYVNGLFNSLYNGWDIIGNGISIGGTTLAEVVYSILIIIAIGAFVKWVI